MLTRRALLGAAAAPGILRAQNRRSPNILLILADDLGYGDLGCYGQKLIRTPNLDTMAAEGVRFTQTYAGSTVCAPSRCTLMTGLHQGHARIRGNKRVPLVAGDITAAKVLRERSYKTGLIGKWGLGNAGTTGIPNRQGFDYFFGYLDQVHAHTSYPTQLWENESEHFLTGNFGTRKGEFSNDLFTERALRFVSQGAHQPWFLYLAYTIPHANNERQREAGDGMEVPDDAPYTGEPWTQNDRNYAAAITRMDRDIGRLLAAVQPNTLVLFSSDNGPHAEGGVTPGRFRSSGPLRGIKRDLYEGGIRVPGLARWPGVVPRGRVVEAPWAFQDFLPTAADVTGAHTPSGLDGRSIVPLLEGRSMPERPYFYWEFHERGFHQAARIGRWKAIRRGYREGPIELYDLEADVGETRDVSATHSEIVARARQVFVAARTGSPEFPVQERF